MESVRPIRNLPGKLHEGINAQWTEFDVTPGDVPRLSPPRRRGPARVRRRTPTEPLRARGARRGRSIKLNARVRVATFNAPRAPSQHRLCDQPRPELIEIERAVLVSTARWSSKETAAQPVPG
jgi:hypothetical protein